MVLHAWRKEMHGQKLIYTKASAEKHITRQASTPSNQAERRYFAYLFGPYRKGSVLFEAQTCFAEALELQAQMRSPAQILATC